MPKKTTKKSHKPFVIDMRHDEGADPSYAVTWTWEEALRVAGAFWETYEGVFDPTSKRLFLAGEGCDQKNVEMSIRRGRRLHLQFWSDGPCVRIERAEKPLGPAPKP